MNKELTLINIWHFIVGNIRYYLYYHKRLKFLIPLHTREQIGFRIFMMNPECYNNGSCVMCGCRTTALQMANKACNKPCYPPMMNKEKFSKFISGKMVKVGGDFWHLREEHFSGVRFYILHKNNKEVHKKVVSDNHV